MLSSVFSSFDMTILPNNSSHHSYTFTSPLILSWNIIIMVAQLGVWLILHLNTSILNNHSSQQPLINRIWIYLPISQLLILSLLNIINSTLKLATEVSPLPNQFLLFTPLICIQLLNIIDHLLSSPIQRTYTYINNLVLDIAVRVLSNPNPANPIIAVIWPLAPVYYNNQPHYSWLITFSPNQLSDIQDINYAISPAFLLNNVGSGLQYNLNEAWNPTPIPLNLALPPHPHLNTALTLEYWSSFDLWTGPLLTPPQGWPAIDTIFTPPPFSLPHPLAREYVENNAEYIYIIINTSNNITVHRYCNGDPTQLNALFHNLILAPGNHNLQSTGGFSSEALCMLTIFQTNLSSVCPNLESNHEVQLEKSIIEDTILENLSLIGI